MEKTLIEDYIKKLQELEENFGENEGEEVSDSLSNSLDKLLKNLSVDIQQSFNSNDFSLKIKIKRLNPEATVPKYSKLGDAGMDLTAVLVHHDEFGNLVCHTGVAMQIPKGYVGLLFPRSSITKKNLSMSNCVGVIDSGYRGEIIVKFKPIKSFGSRNYDESYDIGDRVAQIIILPYPQIEFVETDELEISERGGDGFGSSGS